MADAVRIADELSIPMGELEFRVSRSSGPGGQGVNTTDSRVELRFDVAASAALTDDQRARLLARLRSRLDRTGVLRVVSQRHRSQLANRLDAVARFQALLAEALTVRTPRRPTRPSRAAGVRRVTAKRRRAAVKEARRRPLPDE